MLLAKKSGGTVPGWLALLPFLVFVISFLGAGILLGDFYAFPAPVASLTGIIAAIIILQGSVSNKVNTFIRGCGDEKIITMCVIYLLAGAFATVTKAMGGVEATVNLGLSLIPLQYLGLGIFVLAAFLSTSTGTSVGAIVALGPIAVGLAEKSGISLPLMLGALLGGAMFGDNLSIISDTTIAATQTQGVRMKDKFKVNLFIAGPAALLTILLLFLAGYGTENASLPHIEEGYALWPILPYLLVIGLAVSGLNVFVVLVLGTLISGIMGIAAGNFDVLAFSRLTYEGFTGMTEIFLLSMLTGGLAALVTEAGGIRYLLQKISKSGIGRRSTQLRSALLVGLTNSAIANNTVSIVITGSVVKEMSLKAGIDSRKTAALLDIAACICQGLLPYGAQLLILLSFTNGALTYFDILPYTWYLFLLFGFSLLAIYTPFIDRMLIRSPLVAIEAAGSTKTAA